mmetsp:Transcript_15538/g.38337  ORF Transcript_15538/g.38337 Transcript_15538/m.38337 type:complete len:211 (+) Transcript_15538:164-796(+)
MVSSLETTSSSNTSTSRTTTRSATTFVIRSHKNRAARPFLAVSLIFGLGLYLLWSDWNIQNDLLWFGGGLLMGFVVLETAASYQTEEVSVRITPLGVQIINQRYHHHKAPSSTNNDMNHHPKELRKIKSKFKQPPPKHQPFLPREVVQDCILVEHVGVVSVSTRLIFRLRSCSSSSKSSSIVSILPNSIKLSFGQCHDLAQQIQLALKES